MYLIQYTEHPLELLLFTELVTEPLDPELFSVAFELFKLDLVLAFITIFIPKYIVFLLTALNAMYRTISVFLFAFQPLPVQEILPTEKSEG